MCKEKDRNFLFSLVLIFSLCLAIIAFFCGEEIMKTNCCKVIISVLIIAVIIVVIFIGGYLLFCWLPNWKRVTISPKSIYDEKSMIINDSSNYERNIDDADFEDIVFIKANQKLEEGAFWGYSKLKKIELPAELEEIPNYAFAGCVSLESITIPNSIKKIGEYAFFGCSNLKKIDLSKTKIIEIKKGSFEGCTNLETVILPANLKTLKKCAFKNCKNLKSINISETVEKIEEYTFFSCDNLEDVVFPISLLEISDFAFCDCALKTVKIHASVTKITEKAFEDCKKLETVIFEVPENEKFQKLPETLKNVIRAGKSIKEIKLKTNNTEFKSNLENLIKNEFADREIFVSVEG